MITVVPEFEHIISLTSLPHTTLCNGLSESTSCFDFLQIFPLRLHIPSFCFYNLKNDNLSLPEWPVLTGHVFGVSEIV